MKNKFILIVCILIAFTKLCNAQFEKASFQVNGSSLPFQISFPDNYDETKQYPLLIFLHGAGERGTDNERQLVHGKDFIVENTKSKYPAIVIVPQCPESSFWSNVKRQNIGSKNEFSFAGLEDPSTAMNLLMQLIDYWLISGKVDTKQVYIGGLSMGGMGTLELLWRMPNTFAAAFPICGGGNTEKVDSFAQNTAVWLFHGDSDSVVPVEFSREMYDALKASGCDTKYTEYKGVDHNSWDDAFKEKNLFNWLFNHQK